MPGTLTIITGPMKSGKTTETLRKMYIEAKTGFNVIYLNSKTDTRTDGEFSTHNPLYKEKFEKMDNVTFYSIDSLPGFSIFLDASSIYFDEVQFWKEDDATVISFIMTLVEGMGKNVIVSGLASNWLRQKWGPISALEPFCDNYIRLTSLCDSCATEGKKEKAIFSLKIAGELVKEQVGGAETYDAVCRKCYIKRRDS